MFSNRDFGKEFEDQKRSIQRTQNAAMVMIVIFLVFAAAAIIPFIIWLYRALL